MLNTTSVRLYAARWALLSHEETPTSALSHALLVHLPLWLPRFLLGIFCALLCPHLQAEEITDYLSELGQAEMAGQLVRAIDTDGDGDIDFFEFCRGWQRWLDMNSVGVGAG